MGRDGGAGIVGSALQPQAIEHTAALTPPAVHTRCSTYGLKTSLDNFSFVNEVCACVSVYVRVCTHTCTKYASHPVRLSTSRVRFRLAHQHRPHSSLACPYCHCTQPLGFILCALTCGAIVAACAWVFFDFFDTPQQRR